MGKGDRKSKRGKIIKGSFGVRRRRKASKSFVTPSPKETVKATPAITPEAEEVKPARTARPATVAKAATKPAAKKTAAKPATKKAPAKE